MQLDQAATPGFSGPRRDTGSTARNREYRRRRREGLVIVPIEVKNEEIDTLVARGLVRQGEREDSPGWGGPDDLPQETGCFNTIEYHARKDGSMRFRVLGINEVPSAEDEPSSSALSEHRT